MAEKRKIAFVFSVINVSTSVTDEKELYIGLMLKFSTSTLSTLGVIKAGRLGPRWMSLIPKWRSVSRMATAFCSYQERISDRGKSLTPHSNALDRATAIWIAE